MAFKYNPFSGKMDIVGGGSSSGSSPLTTKGDLYTYSTADTRLAVGTTDGMVLMADSTQAEGVKWGTASASSIVRNEIPSGSINGTNNVFTLVATPVANSLNLFQNGVLLSDGTADYAINANTITFVGTPLSGDKLKADYLINSGYFAVGAASFIKETPSGTPNGTLTTFTLTATPVANSEFIYRDGQLLTGGSADYYLTNGTITFTSAPATSSVLVASYQANASVAGNADTLDGYHANATPTANNIPVLDANALLPLAAIPQLNSPKINENVALTATATQLNAVVGGNLLGYSALTTTQSTITTITDLTAGSVTVNIPGGRNVKITGVVHLTRTNNDDYIRVYIREGSTTLQTFGFPEAATTQLVTARVELVLVAPSAASRTFKLSIAKSLGTGSVGSYVDTGFIGYILVEII